LLPEYRKHLVDLGNPHRGFAAFKFRYKALAYTGKLSQLFLTDLSGVSTLPDKAANGYVHHLSNPDREKNCDNIASLL
jgi:hypothetical protein